jgi:hypothetical protein
MKTVKVTTRPAPKGGFVARAGRRRKARTATRRHAGITATIRAAAYKYFRLDSSNIQGAADIVVTPAMVPSAYRDHDPIRSRTDYIATLPDIPS